ncbi:pyruvate formate lyase family protein [Eubacteriales bacterium OttesenSCG-928-N13]|nr:pyruvate formate lyase family protein [Eubacteriales bacterium OttesenSCG-928-N13]
MAITDQERYRALKQTKLNHTREKCAQQGYMDADDYGSVPLPDGYKFVPIPPDGDFYGYAGWAENFEAFIDNHPVYVDRLELLCGRWCDKLTAYRKPDTDVPLEQRAFPGDRFPYDELLAPVYLYGLDTAIGSDTHFCSDYRIGLRLGWGGFLKAIRQGRVRHAQDPEKRAFYDAEEKTVLAIQRWIARHIAEIKRLLVAEQDPALRISLQKMLECNRNVIEKPASSFLEACQYMAWFNSVSRMYDRDGAGCDLDQILLPYYEKDIERGVLTRDEARFILANLLLVDTHYYQLSGCDLDGNDMTNELSYLTLEAAHELNIAANLTVRYHRNIDPDFFRQAVAYNFNDRNGWPRFSGHEGMMKYLNNQGIDQATALERIAVGCGWSAVPGRELPLNDLVKINCARVFEVALNEMMLSAAEAPKDVYYPAYEPSLERLSHLFKKHLARAVDGLAKCLEFHLSHMHQVMPELVMNLQMRHCIEEGLNVSQCAELYTLCVDGVGLGTVADSFAAIEQRVVVEKKLSWEQLFHALRTNFKDDERTRLMLKNSERYCQGGSLGDKWAEAVTQDFTALVRAQPMSEGKQLVPGWFSWSKTIHFGQQVGATPNGRGAYEPLTHGANPTPGFRRDGAPTALANGIAMVQPGYGNAAPLQIEFDPKISAEEGGIERVAQLIKGHLDQGGTLININVLDRDVLMQAHENPDSHPDLVVRVTGFTAYFCTLSPEFRQLVVDRFLDGL